MTVIEMIKAPEDAASDPCRWMGRINRRICMEAPTALVRDRI